MTDRLGAQETNGMSDQELIVKAVDGDMIAFEELVHRYDRQVLSMAAHYVSSSEDAKDIYQEVFLRVYRGLPRFKFRSEFSTWLYRIATNVCISHRSRRRRHHHSSLTGADEEDESIPHREVREGEAGTPTDQSTLDAEVRRKITNALNHLSPKERMVFTLRHYEDRKLKDIAAYMGCREGTVKKYLFTATRKMRDQLRELYQH